MDLQRRFMACFVRNTGAPSLSMTLQSLFLILAPTPDLRWRLVLIDLGSEWEWPLWTLDMVQFHWWDYSDPHLFDAMKCLYSLKIEGKIKELGLTNFDTEHMATLFEGCAIPVVSNQVAYSIIDTLPEKKMCSFLLMGLCWEVFCRSNTWDDLSREGPTLPHRHSLSTNMSLINGAVGLCSRSSCLL